MLWSEGRREELGRLRDAVTALETEVQLRQAMAGLLKTQTWTVVKEQLGKVQRQKLLTTMQRGLSHDERLELAAEARTIGEIASMPERSSVELPMLVAKIKQYRDEAEKLARTVPEEGDQHG